MSAARRIPVRKRRAPLFIVLAVLCGAAAILLLARWKTGSKQVQPAALPTVASIATAAEAPDAAPAVSVAANPLTSAPAPAASSATVLATASSEPSTKTPQKNTPRKGKGGKGDKKWTPPVTESGL